MIMHHNEIDKEKLNSHYIHTHIQTRTYDTRLQNCNQKKKQI